MYVKIGIANFILYFILQVYIVDLRGKNRKQLTAGKHATTQNPIISYYGDKAAWIELKEDGHEVDRCVYSSSHLAICADIFPQCKYCGLRSENWRSL